MRKNVNLLPLPDLRNYLKMSVSDASTDKSRTQSPIATPTRGAECAVEKIPYGKLWYEKSWSGLMSRKHSASSSFPNDVTMLDCFNNLGSRQAFLCYL